MLTAYVIPKRLGVFGLFAAVTTDVAPQRRDDITTQARSACFQPRSNSLSITLHTSIHPLRKQITPGIYQVELSEA